MTANIVPVCSITSSSVIGGDEGSRPINFSATTTWAELETGSNSANPCTIARMMTFTIGIDDLFWCPDREDISAEEWMRRHFVSGLFRGRRCRFHRNAALPTHRAEATAHRSAPL